MVCVSCRARAWPVAGPQTSGLIPPEVTGFWVPNMTTEAQGLGALRERLPSRQGKAVWEGDTPSFLLFLQRGVHGTEAWKAGPTGKLRWGRAEKTHYKNVAWMPKE